MRAFYGRQVHIATEHYGRFDPLDFDAYAAHDGWSAVRACLQSGRAEAIVEAVRPTTDALADAVDLWEGSEWVASTFGEDVQRHYANMGRIEIEDFARTITDWERYRGFERL